MDFISEFSYAKIIFSKDKKYMGYSGRRCPQDDRPVFTLERVIGFRPISMKFGTHIGEYKRYKPYITIENWSHSFFLYTNLCGKNTIYKKSISSYKIPRIIFFSYSLYSQKVFFISVCRSFLYRF